MARARSEWRCSQCGHVTPKWLGRCPACGEYGTFAEADPVEAERSRGAAPRTPIALSDVRVDPATRITTGIGELDRVLGGGIVRGSVILLAGEPGIGKSTLLLQAASRLASSGRRVLYVCGEESAEQVRLRAERLGADGRVLLLPDSDVRVVIATAESEGVDVLVVDSVQTLSDPETPGLAGSVGQVRACAQALVGLAKSVGVAVVMVGHVTKEGTVAGPRVLEHVVDTVLSFEGDRDHAHRVVRATKNRFGSVSEVGVFEMTGTGLEPISDPSGLTLCQRAHDAPGTCVFPTVEGTRPMLVEVQALVTRTWLPAPRRHAVGVDIGRVHQMLAVLEGRAGLRFGEHDVYVSVVGGVRVSDPAVDLPLALALVSAREDTALPAWSAAFGEVGLTGEIRGVPHGGVRAAECARVGVKVLIAPDGKGPLDAEGIEVARVSSLGAALVTAGLLRDR
ncbi:MAG: DNA repair protein RadA [Anaerosomatales bacterium]|nr:DNA repair protein RadA [Anaerosomatales bacterium]